MKSPNHVDHHNIT